MHARCLVNTCCCYFVAPLLRRACSGITSSEQTAQEAIEMLRRDFTTALEARIAELKQEVRVKAEVSV